MTCQPPAGVQWSRKCLSFSSCFLIPQKRVCLTDHQVWRCWLGHPARGGAWVGRGINKSTVCKDALGLLDSHLLLTGKYGLSLSWNVKSQELGNILACKLAEWALQLTLVPGYPQGGKSILDKGPAWLSDTSQWGLGPESQVPRGLTCSFTLPCSLCSTILGITHGEEAGSTDFGSWTRIIESAHPS